MTIKTQKKFFQSKRKRKQVDPDLGKNKNYKTAASVVGKVDNDLMRSPILKKMRSDVTNQ